MVKRGLNSISDTNKFLPCWQFSLKKIFVSKSVITSCSTAPMMKKKGLWNPFKSKSETKIPVSLVQQARKLLQDFSSSASNLDGSDRKQEMAQFCKVLRKMKLILYGTSESEPVPEFCAQLTEEFFKHNTFRLLVLSLPNLNLEARKDATQVVANLQRQQVKCCLVARAYLEADIDLMDVLVAGYEDHSMALHYGSMLRECIRHQTVAKYVLENHLRKFFGYILLPNFEISSDASATFKELLTRHRSTVAGFISQNYDWFFKEYNTKLLQSPVYITIRQAVKLLGDILLAPTNARTMEKYVSSKENLMIFMDLLKVSHAWRSGNEITEIESCVLHQEPSRVIQLDAFHVFKLFVFNKNKPPEIGAILIANRDEVLRLLACFSKFKENNSEFEVDKAKVERELDTLELNPEIRSNKESETV